MQGIFKLFLTIKYLEQVSKITLLLSVIHAVSCAKIATNHTVTIGPSLDKIGRCHPSINTRLPQFIIGYGSLMQEKSKRQDSSHVGDNYPIYLRGYQRGWIEPGTDIGFSTTYLGVRQDDKARINAVYFKLEAPKAIYSYDKREDTYCRIKVATKQITAIGNQKLPLGEYWIYLTKASQNHLPSARKPIAQSYVDIFLSGCFELEEKFYLHNFAKDCIKTTDYWSKFWVNDRIYPRTAFDNDHYVAKIDPLLAKELPYYFKQIKIE